MIYSDRDLKQLIEDSEIVIEGLRDEAVQPASIDFHLSDRPLKGWADKGLVDIRYEGQWAIDYAANAEPIRPWEDQRDEMISIPSYQGLTTLLPGQFALASTTERVSIGPKVAGRLEGKSSLARLGLIVHTTAGFFDPGFEGYPTLELLNVAPRPMVLRPGMPIAQMAFFEMSSGAQNDYSKRGKYVDQGANPEASQYFRNFNKQEYEQTVIPRLMATHECHCGMAIAHTDPSNPSDKMGWTHVEADVLGTRGMVLSPYCTGVYCGSKAKPRG